MFGPHFDERVDEFCSVIKIMNTAESACEDFKALNDSETWGMEAVPTRLLMHYAQNYIVDTFQEFSDSWGLVFNHSTDLIEVE